MGRLELSLHKLEPGVEQRYVLWKDGRVVSYGFISSLRRVLDSAGKEVELVYVPNRKIPLQCEVQDYAKLENALIDNL